MAEKVRRERAAGIYSFDVFVGAPDTGLTMFKPMGAFIPMTPLLLLPEILDAKSWFGNELPFVDGDKMLFKFKSYPS